jgi:hypothetical protein
MADKQQAYDFGFKRIVDYDAKELELAIAVATEHCKRCKLDFYAILRGIDAYMEKRRRKLEAEAERRHSRIMNETQER